MFLAIRSTLTAGIALAGAGAIAMSPISPVPAPTADIAVPMPHSSWAPVELTALTDGLESPADPITTWLEVFGTAFDNVTQIGGVMAAAPLPVLQQVIANQMANGQILATSLDAAAMSYIQFFTSDEDYRLKYFVGQAFDYLASGNVSAAAGVVSSILFRLFAFANPLINTMQIPLGMGQNVMNALSAVPQMLMPLGLGVLNPVEGVINASGDSIQGVIDAIDAGDPAAAFTSVINTPAVLAGAILNGYYSETAGLTTGLFTQSASELNRGLIETLLVTVPQTIATAIGWQKPVAVQGPATVLVDEPTAQSDVEADLPTASPPVQRKALTATGVVSRPTVDLASAVGRFADTTAAAVKTVTLSVAPQRKVADTQTVGTATENDGAEAASETTGGPGAPSVETDTSAASDTADTKNSQPRNTTRAAKRVAGAVKNVAKAQRGTAGHDAKPRNGGAKHRAGGDHTG
ncbi:hypothetical protein [Mycobacterium sp. NPDC050441]|uniref:hypothetical protein n=1 Tax=Mycobacterium sp. NPDC050441 TaxID=3155403 RepID=UPI0033F88D29